MKKLRAMIIDDERLAREEIKEHIRSCSFIELAGEAADADEAEEKIKEIQPDLIFLDIQMPERSGLDLLESLDTIPEVIFTTAYDQYAVKAFDLNAVDYLVKPIRAERFEQAMEKLRSKLTTTGHAYQQHIFVRENDKFYFIKSDDIYLIESAGNYACLFTPQRKHYIRRSLNQLEKLLDPDVFFRVSRTEIINMQFIKEIVNQSKGKIMVTLRAGNTIEVSRRQSAAFKNKNMI
ncbi:MAG: DNA-binding response regulator [Citrobacter freundii]|nr:MAG: DNA-binding response regulator [Citrobacter freundii]